jgi:hypothetical protein
MHAFINPWAGFAWIFQDHRRACVVLVRRLCLHLDASGLIGIIGWKSATGTGLHLHLTFSQFLTLITQSFFCVAVRTVEETTQSRTLLAGPFWTGRGRGLTNDDALFVLVRQATANVWCHRTEAPPAGHVHVQINSILHPFVRQTGISDGKKCSSIAALAASVSARQLSTIHASRPLPAQPPRT